MPKPRELPITTACYMTVTANGAAGTTSFLYSLTHSYSYSLTCSNNSEYGDSNSIIDDDDDDELYTSESTHTTASAITDLYYDEDYQNGFAKNVTPNKEVQNTLLKNLIAVIKEPPKKVTYSLTYCYLLLLTHSYSLTLTLNLTCLGVI